MKRILVVAGLLLCLASGVAAAANAVSSTSTVRLLCPAIAGSVLLHGHELSVHRLEQLSP